MKTTFTTTKMVFATIMTIIAYVFAGFAGYAITQGSYIPASIDIVTVAIQLIGLSNILKEC